ncbi:MAG: DUF3306 domain-containing protein [Alphaproteobacteria bacterium]|nr:DUF3306 domain-containing protein [Alphaproteobacteria bacterium]
MSGDRFLSRWSRMKARARSEKPSVLDAVERPRPEPDAGAWRPAAPAAVAATLGPEPAEGAADGLAPAEAAAAAEAQSARPDPVDEEAVLAEWPEDLPRPETLDASSDYTRFFSPEVSEAVRNIALRRLWRSNPLLANVDGLVDYGEDFTDAATVIAGMKSAYEVGRGYAKQTEEALAKAEQATDGAPADDPSDAVVAANDPEGGAQAAHGEAHGEAPGDAERTDDSADEMDGEQEGLA